MELYLHGSGNLAVSIFILIEQILYDSALFSIFRELLWLILRSMASQYELIFESLQNISSLLCLLLELTFKPKKLCCDLFGI